MIAEKLLLLMAQALYEKSKELHEDHENRRDWAWRMAEIELCRKIISEAENALDRIESKVANQYAQATKKRVVFKLWKRLKW